MKYTNENGRSMVEMLGVLAIIGVLSVGGIAGYSKAMNKFKINKTTDQVSMLIANLRTMFSAQGNYKGLDNAQAVNFGIVPDDMYDTCTTASCNLKNPFGGSVVISSSDLKAGTGENATHDQGAFRITYDNLSKEACVTLATGDWGSGQSSGLIAIIAAKDAATATTAADGNKAYVTETAGTAVTSDGAATIAIPGGSAVKTPMPVSNAVKSCSSSANAVIWKYY